MTFRVLLFFACVCWTTAPAVAHAQAAASARPNVVLIITDDMGWADLGSYGASDVRTPNIDSLARDGVRMTRLLLQRPRLHSDAGRPDLRALSAAIRPRGSRCPARRSPAADVGLPATRPFAAAVALAARVCDGAHRQVASRLPPRVQPGRARLRVLLRPEERVPRLLCSTPLATESRTCGRTIGRSCVEGYTTDLITAAVGEVPRAAGRAAVLPGGRLQRAALAVSAAGSAVGGAGQRAPRCGRGTKRPARAPTTWRWSNASIAAWGRSCRRSSAWTSPGARSSSSPTTTAASGWRATGRCSTARAACGRAGFACRR